MLIIPIKPVPSQYVTANLAGQPTQVTIYQRSYGLFVDVYVSNVLIVAGVLCENLNTIVRSAYLGFIGDLTFIDNIGKTDPYYTGLGTRYSLAYVEAADLAAPNGLG